MVDPERLFRYFATQAGPGVMGDRVSFQDHFRAYCDSEHLPTGGAQGGRGSPGGSTAATSHSNTPAPPRVPSSTSASGSGAPAQAQAPSGAKRILCLDLSGSYTGSSRVVPVPSISESSAVPQVPSSVQGKDRPLSRAQGPDQPPEGSSLVFDMEGNSGGSGDKDDGGDGSDDLHPQEAEEEEEEEVEEVEQSPLLPGQLRMDCACSGPGITSPRPIPTVPGTTRLMPTLGLLAPMRHCSSYCP
ncbi:hypothetical protein PHYSODRAFT_307871 [Phytophthora sojae]|uniref:Uncharacterized protein n=1 Tax=Phytophthora sojae (strain P6497) TaxID=1094619 RepID=G5AGL3_PHYSP|nr:hypothetical protein PHYSODRAFT_307871 [Phytophthora sojae]EGZ05293.1 hypothetical protein PHYSODRAFT_307871 [Phytophthora sojae]|eukprot:XP_009539214.1 hypothetical protein PHYSODRAFT_307871 [Phytophthora sojae]